MEQAIVAGGCFWCTEAVFRDVIGVSEVESGYIGGTVADPTYKQVCSGTTGHAEGIRVTYDPAVISLPEIYDVFLGTHDPAQLNRQGNDVGTQYRSAIFPHSPEQESEAQAGIDRAQADQSAPIVTAIEADAPWYPAEDYHQKYWDRVGDKNPYCMAMIPPKLAKLRKGFEERIAG